MRLLVFLAFIFFLSAKAIAQPGDPGTDPDVPIGGLEILLAAGAAFGAKKIYDSSRKSNK